MDKNFYKFLFVVLVYRNSTDLYDFIISVKQNFTNYKIVVVNSYYDNESMKVIEDIAISNDCEFINVANKGYSYGNNLGIGYAKKKYDFDYLIVSNPDIIIESPFDELLLDKKSITGPQIRNRKGRLQNPMMVNKNNFIYTLIYYGYKSNIMGIALFGILLNKLINSIFIKIKMLRKDNSYRVFQLHGSFYIFPKEIVEKFDSIFDENMFLFCEEGVLAYKSYELGIPMLYNSELKVYHKEDGSMSFFNGTLKDVTKNSISYFYHNYVKE